MCLMEKMDTNNYAQRVEKLEDEELELKTSTPEFYLELLALYLYQNELVEAKNLLLRIPNNIRTDNPELSQLELLVNSANNSAEFFKNLKFEWSETTKDIMQNLKAKAMEEFFHLIALAYTSILEQNLLHMTQLSPEELRTICQGLGWSYEEGNPANVILPVQGLDPPPTFGNSKHQMFKLTEFVTFLEN